jgi:dTDP-4-dehydrorhamnose reductase
MKILVFGKNGQLAKQFARIANNYKEFSFTFIQSSQLDFSFPEKVLPFLNNIKEVPDIIINTSAYTKVDNAEDEKTLCNNINNLSVLELAKYCKQKSILLITFSTDYVFSGIGNKPFNEDNVKDLNPLSTYGLSKLNMEKSVTKTCEKYLIFRTSWIYSEHGNNFPNTMLKLFKSQKTINVVNDQIGSPTYAFDVADSVMKIISKKNYKHGIYNIVNSGFTSWYDFANFILESYKKQKPEIAKGFIIEKIISIPSSSYKTKATRPLNSRLSCKKLQQDFAIVLRNYKTAFLDFLSID